MGLDFNEPQVGVSPGAGGPLIVDTWGPFASLTDLVNDPDVQANALRFDLAQIGSGATTDEIYRLMTNDPTVEANWLLKSADSSDEIANDSTVTGATVTDALQANDADHVAKAPVLNDDELIAMDASGDGKNSGISTGSGDATLNHAAVTGPVLVANDWVIELDNGVYFFVHEASGGKIRTKLPGPPRSVATAGGTINANEGLLILLAAATGTFTLPIPVEDNIVTIKSLATAQITIAQNAAENIYDENGVAQTSIVLDKGDTEKLWSDGTDWYLVT